MPTPKLTEKTRQLIVMYLQQGFSYREVRNLLNKNFRLSISTGTISNVRFTADVANRPGFGRMAPGIKADKKVGRTSWRDWTPQLEAMQRLKHRGSFTQDTVGVELGDGKSPVALATLSDMHMGAWSTDYELLRTCTDDLLAVKNLFVGLIGDYGQYAIKLRNVLEVSDNLLPPEQQTQFIESWFDEIWHKVAFATWDNHAVERQEQLAGESGIKKMLSKKVVYFNGIGHVDIKVGSQVYHGVVSHKFRGNSFLNPVHGIMRYMRFEGIDREFGMAGDSHVPGMLKYVDGKQVRVAVNTGSLQTNSGYGKRYFSLTTHPVFPIAVLHHDRHEITPYWSLREYLDCTKAVQKLRKS